MTGRFPKAITIPSNPELKSKLGHNLSPWKFSRGCDTVAVTEGTKVGSHVTLSLQVQACNFCSSKCREHSS